MCRVTNLVVKQLVERDLLISIGGEKKSREERLLTFHPDYDNHVWKS